MLPVKSPVHSNNTESLNSSIAVIRPSSPRQFFERLYGHLETGDSNSKQICSPGQSELSSSPDLIDDRYVFGCRCLFSFFFLPKILLF